jgi:carbonic anhydrase/acetyltransferase-like protein (isoleucine patch superfamily)
MLVEHAGARPEVHPTAYVAPTAVLCGDVRVGPHCRVLFGAVLTAESGPVELADHVVVMEHAVVRGTRRDPVTVGSRSLLGPRSYVSGARIGSGAFLATGSSVFNGAEVGDGAEVRVNGVVHLRTRLPAGATVPIGWIAVGDPLQVLPPDRHDDIWEAQRPLDFPGYVFGVDRDAPGADPIREIVERYGDGLASHQADRQL